MGLLERLEAGDGRSDLVGIMGPEWNQLGHRAIVLRDDEAFSRFHPLEELWQMCFRFKCTNFKHLTGSSI